MARWLLVLLTTALFTGNTSAQDFVRVAGLTLRTEAGALQFVGANVSVMHGGRERAEAEQTLTAAAEDGLKVVRLWALGEAPAGAPAWWSDYAFRSRHDAWYDGSLAHLDRVLASARAKGLRVIIVLANRWKDYGGVPQYLRWAARSDVPLDKHGDVSSAGLREFFRLEAAREAYRAHVKRLVERVNGVTGVPYRDDPTIMTWELMNELSADTKLDQLELVAWVQMMATFIKALDPNHLVSAGHIGYATQRERAAWRAVQELPEVDYCDVHAYPREMGDDELLRWTDDRIQLCHGAIRKPLVFGEFGFDGKPASRAQRVGTWLTRLRKRGVAGSLIWFYEPGSAPRAHTIATSAAAAHLTHAVRKTVAQQAASLRRSPRAPALPRPDSADTAAPLHRLDVLVHGDAAPARGLAPRSEPIRTLVIDPFAFSRARFERAGRFDGPPVTHVYGLGAGYLEYQFRTPVLRVEHLTLRMRASSELYGDGWGADPSETSRVHVELDGLRAASLELPVDNGRGHDIVVEIDRAAVLEKLSSAGVHRLRLVVDGTGSGSGICIYRNEVGVEEPGATFIALDFTVAELAGSDAAPQRRRTAP